MTTHIFIIREAGISDLGDIHSIEVESFMSPWSEKSLRNEFSNSFSRVVVAESGGKIIGYAIAWEVKGEIQVNHIAVRAEFRRRGAGKALMDYLVDEMKPRGAERVLLEVRSKNTQAREFYRALGFVEQGTRRNYYPDDDAILLEKDIEK